MDIRKVMETWETDGVYRDWYAVDELRMGSNSKRPPEVMRLFIGSQGEAADVAARYAAGSDLIDYEGNPASPGEFGEYPFFRMTLISTRMAEDFFKAALTGVEFGNRMLTMKEVAEKKGCSKQAVHELVKRGRLEAEEVAGSLRISEAALLLFTPGGKV